jgi:DNA repair exonuclease SbcCD nuclease subunit
MKRTKQLKPAAILTGDFHLRETSPICRTDDFWKAQWNKVDFIRDLQEKYQCPVLHSGDLFNHWKPSPYLLSTAIKKLPDQFFTVFGNHDLPQHSLEQKEKCGIETLKMAGKLTVLDGIHWEQDPAGIGEFVIWHVMTYIGKSPWPGCTDLTAFEILEKYPDFDLIVTGHNHKTFTWQIGNRLLVNPGSLTRMSADQTEHEPCVFLWYSETNTVKRVTLPFEKHVISRDHIDQPQERRERMEAYINNMQTGWQVGLSFEKNLERFFSNNKVTKKIRSIIWDSLEPH